MKKITILLAALMIVSAAAIAQPSHHADGNDKKELAQHHQKHEMISNLTDEQREAIKKIKTDGKKQTLPIKNQLNEKRAKMKTLTTAEKADMKKIDALIDEMSDLQAQLMKIKARQTQEIRSQLTEEQRLEFDTKKHDRKEMHKRHMKHNGGKL